MSVKKLLVVSDSHGHLSSLRAVFDWANERIPPKDAICATACCGDGLLDLRKVAIETGFYSEWKVVLGNNDYGVQAPETAVFDFEGHRFFLCHGHRHGLYTGYQKLINAAKSADADVVLFGHTHVPYNKIEDGVLLVNPGSVSRPRSRIGASFAVIECEEDKPAKADFFGISSHNVIHKVKV